jgi:hypothetical protein
VRAAVVPPAAGQDGGDSVTLGETLKGRIRTTTALALGDVRAQGQVRGVPEVTAPLPGTDFSAIFPVDVRPQRG